MATAWCALLAIDIDMDLDINDDGAYTFVLPTADLAAGRYDRIICDQSSA